MTIIGERFGDNVTIGAGSVVVKDIPDKFCDGRKSCEDYKVERTLRHALSK